MYAFQVVKSVNGGNQFIYEISRDRYDENDPDCTVNEDFGQMEACPVTCNKCSGNSVPTPAATPGPTPGPTPSPGVAAVLPFCDDLPASKWVLIMNGHFKIC